MRLWLLSDFFGVWRGRCHCTQGNTFFPLALGAEILQQFSQLCHLLVLFFHELRLQTTADFCNTLLSQVPRMAPCFWILGYFKIQNAFYTVPPFASTLPPLYMIRTPQIIRGSRFLFSGTVPSRFGVSTHHHLLNWGWITQKAAGILRRFSLVPLQLPSFSHSICQSLSGSVFFIFLKMGPLRKEKEAFSQKVYQFFMAADASGDGRLSYEESLGPEVKLLRFFLKLGLARLSYYLLDLTCNTFFFTR